MVLQLSAWQRSLWEEHCRAQDGKRAMSNLIDPAHVTIYCRFCKAKCPVAQHMCKRGSNYIWLKISRILSLSVPCQMPETSALTPRKVGMLCIQESILMITKNFFKLNKNKKASYVAYYAIFFHCSINYVSLSCF